jgi:taurine transport system substrate-binding protein
LGGGSQDFLKAVADFFVKSGNIPKARSSYESAVVTSGLESVAKM